MVWLPLLPPSGYLAVMLIAVHWRDGRVGLLVVDLLWIFACSLLVPLKLVSRKAFRSKDSEPCISNNGVFSNRDMPSNVGRHTRATAWLVELCYIKKSEPSPLTHTYTL